MTATPLSLLNKLRSSSDQEAWSRLVRLYTPLLWRWLIGRGAQPTDAADVVQEIFLVLLRKLPEFTYDANGSFRAWLHTITLNKWRDLLRARLPQPVADDHPALANLATDYSAADLFEAEEYRRQVASRALRLIADEFQDSHGKAFWECVVAGRPAVEVAAELGLTVNVVYLAKSRILRRLREELDGLLA